MKSNNLTKKIVAIILSVVMITGLMPYQSFADTTDTTSTITVTEKAKANDEIKADELNNSVKITSEAAVTLNNENSERTFDIQEVDYKRACQKFGIKYESKWEGVAPYSPLFGQYVKNGKETRPLGDNEWGNNDWMTGYLMVDLESFGNFGTEGLPKDSYGLSTLGIVRVDNKYNRTDDFNTWNDSIVNAFKEYNGNLGFGKNGYSNSDVDQSTKLVIWDGYRRIQGFKPVVTKEYVKRVEDIASDSTTARQNFSNYVKKHLDNGAKLQGFITVADGLKDIFEPTRMTYRHGEKPVVNIPQIKITGLTYDVELEHKNAPDSADFPNLIKVKVGTELEFPKIDGYSKEIFDLDGNLIEDKIKIHSNKKFILKWKKVNEKVDTDKDGLTDYIEINFIGTDPTKVDTDEDELSDYVEIYNTFTDPLKKDSDENGILDSDEDFDKDGLTNKNEIEIGTNPAKIDTDNDGLSDGDEKTIYFTNPLNPDTDGDGILDGDEIKLGLNPTKNKTDDKTLDSEVKIEQTIDDTAKSDNIIESENWLKPSISGKVAGNISKNVYIEESDTDIFEDNRAVLSDFLEISTTYKDDISLSFKFLEEYKGDVNNLVIVKFDDDLKVLETKLDNSNGTISANINESGLYFVIDLDEFLKGFGIDVLSNTTDKTKSRNALKFNNNYSYKYDNNGNLIEKKLKEKTKNDELIKTFEVTNAFRKPAYPDIPDDSNKVTGKADIVFVIDTTGSMSGAIEGVKNNINKFADELVGSYNIDANFALIEYRDIVEDGKNATKVHKSNNSEWFTNVDIFKNEIKKLAVSGGGDSPETPIDGLELARKLSFRENSTKFVVLVTDAGYKIDNSYDISGLSEMANLFKQSDMIVSAISSDFSEYEVLLNTTDGVYGYIYDDFYTTLLKLASKIGDVTNNGGEWILLSDYEAVKLSDKLENKDKNDTDKDGLKDGEELTTSFEKDLGIFIKMLLKKQKIPFEEYTGKSKVVMWNYKSNPVLLDTDYDGIPDGNVDYDGIKVKSDIEPKNNEFSGIYHWKEGEKYYSTKELVKFSVNYSLLFKDNEKYNKKLSELCSLYAGDIYNDSYLKVKNGAKGGSDNSTTLFKLFGMKDVENIQIGKYATIDTDDKSEIVIGHREIEYKNAKKEVILLVVRGTNGTNTEWSSNFDIGANTSDYFEKTGKHPEWVNKKNHKGFDVTSNRIIAEVNDYITNHSLAKKEKSILITGHSRGAGIANLLGKYFDDNAKYKAFTYTFAAPNTSTDVNVQKYRSIFNIVNKDDLITKMPIGYWGFKKYGVIKAISVEDAYENKWGSAQEGTWEWLIGNGKDYNNDGGTQRTLNSFKDICDTREEVYVIDESYDGKAIFSGPFLSYEKALEEKEKAKKVLSKEKMLKFCKLSIEKKIISIQGIDYESYNVVSRYCPAYLTQSLANMTTSVGPMLGQNVTGKYVTAKRNFVLSSGELIVGGMRDPHLPVTYYLISHNNFKKID